MITENGTVILIDSFNVEGKITLKIRAEYNVERITFKVREQNGDTAYAFNEAFQDKCFESVFHIENAKLWSYVTPTLYSYELTLFSNGEVERATGNFGFRTIDTDDKNVRLNGKKIFVRGYIRGAKAHEHGNNTKLTEEEFYRKNIVQAKRFGFNYIRFHSTVPNETFFRVADEEGILVHIELREPNDSYNNLTEMLFQERDLVSDEFIQSTIECLYNHPSLAVYCLGNELKKVSSKARVVELGALIKRLDASRLFIDTCAWGEINRPNVDIDVQHLSYYFPFGKHAEMYNDVSCIHTLQEQAKTLPKGESPFNVPLIAHEVCHYTALRDFVALKEKFQKAKTQEPWWIDEEIKMINAKGLQNRYPFLYNASKKFQLSCWKTAFEKMRSSSFIGGFHFLQFADTDAYENSNGVVDCFDDENYVSPDDFNTFNGDIVLICDMQKELFETGETASFSVLLSNYSEKNYDDAFLECVLMDSNQTIYAKEERVIGKLERGNDKLCDVAFLLPQAFIPQGLTIKLSLKNNDGVLSQNEKNIWTFPTAKRRSYQDFVSYEKDDVVITDDVYKTLRALQKGKRVAFIYRSPWTRHLLDKKMPAPEYAFKATWNRFKPVIWDRGTNYGGYVERDLFHKYGFTTSEYYDFNYAVLTEDCDKINLDDFPVPVKSLISGIDKSCRDRFDAYKFSFNLPELQYDRTLRNFSYMFEVGVGKGRLLVCGLNLTALDESEPSTLAMANFIQEYVVSKDFNPTSHMEIDEFIQYLQSCAKTPVKERMMTQFWQLDQEPVESEQYWVEARAYLMEDETNKGEQNKRYEKN